MIEFPGALLSGVESPAMNHNSQGLAPLAGGCENHLDVPHGAVQPAAVRRHTGGPRELSARDRTLVHPYSPIFSWRVIKSLVFLPTPHQRCVCLLSLPIMQKSAAS